MFAFRMFDPIPSGDAFITAVECLRCQVRGAAFPVQLTAAGWLATTDGGRREYLCAACAQVEATQ